MKRVWNHARQTSYILLRSLYRLFNSSSSLSGWMQKFSGWKDPLCKMLLSKLPTFYKWVHFFHFNWDVQNASLTLKAFTMTNNSVPDLCLFPVIHNLSHSVSCYVCQKSQLKQPCVIRQLPVLFIRVVILGRKLMNRWNNLTRLKARLNQSTIFSIKLIK